MAKVMVKVTIEIDGEEPQVLTGEYAWGAVSTEEDDGIAAHTYLIGNTNVCALATDMAGSLSSIISNSTNSERAKVAFLTKLVSEVMRETAGILKKEAVENAD